MVIKNRSKKKNKPTRLKKPPSIELAVKYHQAEKLEKAERIYKRILQSDPKNVDALHFLGILHHQHGQSDSAIDLIEKAISLCPNYADAYNNLGNVLKESGHLAASERAYLRVTELDSNNADAWSNLGVLLGQQTRFEEAENAYRRALAIKPVHIAAWQNLGSLLAKMDRLSEAIQAYLRVLELKPNVTTYNVLGKTLYRIGRSEEAIAVYIQWLVTEPNNPIALHMLAACTGKGVPTRATNKYIKDVFDSFADSFDHVLENLDYRAPSLIGKVVQDIFTNFNLTLTVLDAGCGTGLCGQFLRPYASKLTGVDLSSAMLAKAKSLNIYDKLYTAELTTYLTDCHEAYDLIISADTLCYFGDITTVIKAASNALRCNGYLIFTLEKMATCPTAPDYTLNPSGRYSHQEQYIINVIINSGLNLVSLSSPDLRQEGKQSVSGFLVCSTKNHT